MITNTLSLFNLVVIVCMACVVVHNFSRLRKYRTDRSKLYDKISMLYPLVQQEFYSKTLPQQTVENNQEILEIKQELEAIKEQIKEIKGNERVC